MLSLSGQPIRDCEGISRRSLLKIGTLCLGGLTLADLLALKSQAAINTPTSGSARKTSVIYFEMAGGPTHFETYDPKPDAPEEYRGPMKAVQTALPGVNFCEILPEQAKIADKLASQDRRQARDHPLDSARLGQPRHQFSSDADRILSA